MGILPRPGTLLTLLEVLLLSKPAIMKLCPEPSSTVVSAERLLSAGTSELMEKSSSDTVGRTRIDMRPSDRTVGVKASCTPYCLNSIVFPWSPFDTRSEEHTSALQSLMRISYAVFCLTNKT